MVSAAAAAGQDQKRHPAARPAVGILNRKAAAAAAAVPYVRTYVATIPISVEVFFVLFITSNHLWFDRTYDLAGNFLPASITTYVHGQEE